MEDVNLNLSAFFLLKRSHMFVRTTIPMIEVDWGGWAPSENKSDMFISTVSISTMDHI